MPSVVIVGAQWGDEGKGKIVDFCAKDADCVVRYQGGANAGHTIIADGRTLKLQILPSGVLYSKQLLIGAGVVIDLQILSNEIEQVKSLGIDVNLVISGKAHVTLPYHNALDQKWEISREEKKIGTTGHGIGPTYADKMRRHGVRMEELTREDYQEKIRININIANKILHHILNDDQYIDFDEIMRYIREVGPRMRDYIGDVSKIVNEALDNEQNVLFEGAQATMLDIDHGTYPYVTSSNPIAGGACTGVGVGPTRIDQVLGICKAYTTRVGAGPFPTELIGPIGEKLQVVGKEFGTVTGRPRRCGWLDLNMIRYAKRINGLTGLALTKMDVLNGFDKVKVCNSYLIDGIETENVPIQDLERCKPIYFELDGWNSLFEGNVLCQEAKEYVKKIEEIVGIPIYYISTGPGREEIICLRNVWS